jgi:pyridinium-3,5-biscarboxylic acid mononucleotide sulfurtransferase
LNLQDKYNRLRSILQDLKRVVIAFSGGVDSTFLLRAAVDTLGPDQVLACISVGPFEPKHLIEQARILAGGFSVRLIEIAGDECDDAALTANPPDRCYLCKSRLFERMWEIARAEGFEQVLCGSNADDLNDFRPGHRAIEQFGVRCPLVEAGLSKPEIRELSRGFGLPTADQPASPCLASRIPYGLEITPQRLEQIEKAEDFLRQRGFVEFRVRHHGEIARIEVPAKDLARMTAEPFRGQIVAKFKGLGFAYVCLDLQGFRSGAMNEILSDQQKDQYR